MKQDQLFTAISSVKLSVLKILRNSEKDFNSHYYWKLQDIEEQLDELLDNLDSDDVSSYG